MTLRYSPCCKTALQRSCSRPLYLPAIPPRTEKLRASGGCSLLLRLNHLLPAAFIGRTAPASARLHHGVLRFVPDTAALTPPPLLKHPPHHGVSFCPCYHAVARFLFNFCFQTYRNTARESQSQQQELLEAVKHHLLPLLSIFCMPSGREC